jgi:hypothetical protein
MAKFLQFALRNINSLTQHTEELKIFISIHNIDISEMHFTEKNILNLSKYTVHHTNYPAGSVRGGTAIIIKNFMKHHQLQTYSQDFLHATSVSMEDSVVLLTILAVYLPPNYTAKQEQVEDVYNTFGRRFIAGGDYSGKHTDWLSRLITPR